MAVNSYRKDQFLITRGKLENIPEYLNQVEKLTSAYFYYEKSSNLTQVIDEDVNIIMLGYVLDIRDSKKDSNEILKHLSKQYKISREYFYDALDYLNGRYILIVDDSDDTQVYTDATSMKPIYYWNKELFGSHEVIVREVVKKNRNVTLKTRWTNGYMDYTGTQSIYKFNCNNYFSFKENQFSRYFPRYDIENQSAEEIAEKTIPFLKNQVEWLSKLDKTLYLSLTGGMDSKVSLAILKSIKSKLNLFTYLIDFEKEKEGPRKDIYTRDKELVDRLVYNFDLKHKYYNFEDLNIPDEFIKQMKYNFSSAHSDEVAYLVRENMDFNSIHIKSNIYEMAKLPYTQSGYKVTKIEDGYNISKKWLPRSIRDKNDIGKKMYLDAARRCNLNREEILNANLSMMLYLESKLSNWHSSITQETEGIQETFIFFNSKFLLRNLLSLKMDERRNTILLSLYIKAFWPFLNYQVANSYNTLDVYRSNRIELVHPIESLRIANPMNVSMKTIENKVTVKPYDGIALRDTNISFEVVNDSSEDVSVNIKSNYSHPEKNIFIIINKKKLSINNYIEGQNINIKGKTSIQVQIEYRKNFKYNSWVKAGELTIG